MEGFVLVIKNNDWFFKINYFFLGGYGYVFSLFYLDVYFYLFVFLCVLGIFFVVSMVIFVFVVNLVIFSFIYYVGWLMVFFKKRSYFFVILYGLFIYCM